MRAQVVGTLMTLYGAGRVWAPAPMVYGGVLTLIAPRNPGMQALAIMALGVKEKVSSPSDNSSSNRTSRTDQHEFRIADDLDASP